MLFDSKDTATSTLMNVFGEQPQKGENMAAFAIRLRSLLKTKWQNVTMAEVINVIILHRVSPHDQRIEQVALEKDIQTADQFLSEMRFRRTIWVHNDAVWIEKCTVRFSEGHSQCLRRPRLFIRCCLFGWRPNYCRLDRSSFKKIGHRIKYPRKHRIFF